MRAAHLQPTRPEWYDRTPLSVSACFQGNAAPHATTVRYSYTVPTGRKAYLENSFVYVQRGIVAAPASNAASQVRYTAFGNTICTYLMAGIVTNNVGDQFGIVSGASFLGYAGDAFEGSTVDLSTGGNIAYRNFSKWTEFDV